MHDRPPGSLPSKFSTPGGRAEKNRPSGFKFLKLGGTVWHHAKPDGGLGAVGASRWEYEHNKHTGPLPPPPHGKLEHIGELELEAAWTSRSETRRFSGGPVQHAFPYPYLT